MGIATFTDIETGAVVQVTTDGANISSIGRGDKGTHIICHTPKDDGSLVREDFKVREDFCEVINALSLALTR